MKRLLVLPILALCAPVWAVVNVNTASQAELEQLPGIGPGRAQAIVEERTAHGPFRSLEDLGRVKGIGAKTLAELKKEVSFDLPVAAPAPQPAPPASAPGGSGIPWAMVGLVVLLAGLAVLWLLVKRRGATVPVTPPVADVPRKAPATSPPPVPAARPAGPATSAAATPAPPRPAGTAGGNAQPSAAQQPAPAGAPPRPAGSRPEKR